MKIIAANWKMNHAFDEADAWLEHFLINSANVAEQLSKREVVLCPPAFIIDYLDGVLMEDGFEMLEEVMKRDGKKFEDFSNEELTKIVLDRRPLRLGAQDCHFAESGAFTGDVSAAMLKKIGCEYVILGHSERRSGHFETSEIISKKVAAAVKEGLTPIICVGENKEMREAKKHLQFVYQQVMNSLPQGVKFEKLIFAYEPIWAIGSGVTPSAAEISEMAKLFEKIFAEKFSNIADEFFMLYGGSVSSKNSQEILAISGVGGLLVGGASLDAEEFLKICIS